MVIAYTESQGTLLCRLGFFSKRIAELEAKLQSAKNERDAFVRSLEFSTDSMVVAVEPPRKVEPVAENPMDQQALEIAAMERALKAGKEKHGNQRYIR